MITISTMARNDRRLLIVKDSFANNFVPFMTPHFRDITIVDPRYFTGTLDDIMDTYRITDVLFLYSGNTFFTDTNLNLVLGGGVNQ